jgi:hypothetical protein
MDLRQKLKQHPSLKTFSTSLKKMATRVHRTLKIVALGIFCFPKPELT